MRGNLHSLHHVLKGLRTLSRDRYEPPGATDFVVVDYDDTATFDPQAGYYHPQMRTTKSEIIPSSDRLLHEFLVSGPVDDSTTWAATNCNGFSILEKTRGQPPESPASKPVLQFDAATALDSFTIRGQTARRALSGDPASAWRLTMNWRFTGRRAGFPWMVLMLSSNSGVLHQFTKGLCVPGASVAATESWSILAPPDLPPGSYRAHFLFYDNTNATGAGRVVTDARMLDAGWIEVDAAR
jgi:hypothetical protein